MTLSITDRFFEVVVPIAFALISICIFSGIDYTLHLSNTDRTCNNKATLDVYTFLLLSSIAYFLLSLGILGNMLHSKMTDRRSSNLSTCSGCMSACFGIMIFIDCTFFIIGISSLQVDLICSKSLIIGMWMFAGYFIFICAFFVILVIGLFCHCLR